MTNTKSLNTLELLAQRIRSGSTPGNRKESPKRKIALIPQGGTMRFAVSAGMAIALQEMIGESEPFDIIYGVSSGAWTAAYFKTNQLYEGVACALSHLTHNFITKKNLLTGKFNHKPVVNIDYLIDGAKTVMKLDTQKIIDSKAPLCIYATDADTCRWVEFKKYKKEEDVFAALHATVQIPYFAGPPFEWKGKKYYDGGVSAGRVPIWKAIEDGCTDVIVLWTDKHHDINYHHPFLEQIICNRLKYKYPEFVRNYWIGQSIHKATIDLIKHVESGNLPPGYPNISVIKVANEKDIVTDWETRPEKLHLAGKAGYDAMREAMKDFSDIVGDRTFPSISEFTAHVH